MSRAIDIRDGASSDVPALSKLAGELVRLHHHVDGRRFFLPDDVEGGYAWWFGRELKRKDALILVAAVDGEPVGYCYATMEGRDWNLLLDEHGAIHDVFVAAESRRSGAGKLLVEAMLGRLRARGVKQIVLSTMVSNVAAQALFRACGFRPTMMEMTYDSPE